MADTTSTTSTGVTLSGASFSALGVGSGMDLSSIVTALVTDYSKPKTSLQNQLTKHNNLVTQYQSLNTKFSTIQSAAQNLNLGLYWNAKKATSSSSTVTATATNAAVAGAFSFQVNKLARAESLASYGSVASTDTVVGTGNLLVGNAGKLGLNNITGTGLAAGKHTVEVTQASNGATTKGTALADSITLDGTETFNYSVDGQAKSFSLTAGTYNQQDLAKMITANSSGTLNVSVNSDKSLQVTSANEGSAATMSITGGTALTKVGLATTGTLTGTNGIIKVDGVANTVTSIKANGSNTATLNSTAGTITTSFEGGLRVGKADVANISLGDGKLSTVVSAINTAGVGVSAAAIQAGTNQFKLQLQATTAGSDGEISTDFSKFESTLGHIETVSEAQDAELQIGTGANAYTVKSSTNNITNVFPGVTLNVTEADPTKTITLNVTGDGTTMSGKVKTLIDGVNDALKYIKDNSKYDADSKTAGALLGNSQARILQSQLSGVMTSAYSSSSLKALANIGIKSNADGGFDFDQTKFENAFAADPEAVASMFVDGGTKGTTTGSPGFAEALSTMTKNATNAITGSISTAINGEKTTITSLNKQIDDWTTRITKYQDMIILQFSAADTAVNSLQSQLSYLNGQISRLG